MRLVKLAVLVARRAARALPLVAVVASAARPVLAQELPRVSVTRKLKIGGIGVEPGLEDLLGLGRMKFQGVIAAELSSIGYQLVDEAARGKRDAAGVTLTLVGTVKEEICDSTPPSQCRIAILWELQDPRGVAQYRTLTRAVDQRETLEKLRRGLIDSALRSLLQRRRFALQLTDVDASKPAPTGPLGFKQCGRGSLALPQAARAVAASLVLVESGSNLGSGAIVSGDGLILTGAKAIEPDAPLRVRFSAEQTLPAEVVAIDRVADVALLHVEAHTNTTCLPLRDTPLATNLPVYGVSSEPGEDRATSLTGSVVQKTEQLDDLLLLQIDPRIARVQGGPLLDDQGRLAGVVSARYTNRVGAGSRGVEVSAALRALNIRPATITDPRLMDALDGPAPAIGYVRDHDDPPFVLTKRYTYGTSPTAHRLRTLSIITASVGAAGVAGSWATYRASPNVSPSGHTRFVVINDLSWVLFGLGAVGIGTSFALPEGHDIVAVQHARRELFVGVGAGGLELAGQF